MLEKLFIAISILITSMALGFLLYTNYLYKTPLPDDKIELEAMMNELPKKNGPTETFVIKKLIVNLKSKTKKLRFVDLSLHLVPFKSSYTIKIEQNQPIIKDRIIQIAGGMEPSELNTTYGKLLFENRIKSMINKLFKKSIIKEIYFTKFVIQ